jgi:hypothetical protein
MTTSNDNRQRLIQRVLAQTNGGIADVSAKLWQQLAAKLTTIIGRGGFTALFTRSLYLTQKEFSWLVPRNVLPAGDLHFSELKLELAKQNSADAYKATAALLLAFTDILASLIGESLTIDLINSAWGDSARDMEKPGKGF